MKQLKVELNAFGSDFEPHLDSIKNYLHAPLTRMQGTHRGLESQVDKRTASWRYKLWPDFYTVLLDSSLKHGATCIEKEKTVILAVDRILDEAKEAKNYEKIGLLMVNSPMIRERVGFDLILLGRVKKAQEAVFYERKKLDPDFKRPDGKPAVNVA